MDEAALGRMNKRTLPFGAALAGCVFVALIVYLPALRGPFLGDDEFLVEKNAHLGSVAHLDSLMSESIGAGSGRRGPSYRPVQMLTYLIDHHLWGGRPPGYHVSSVLWHALAAFLCGLFLLEWTKRPLAAAAAGLLFLVHPLHTQSVAYISGRADSLAAAGIFATLLFILRLSDGSRRALAPALFCYAGALLSKEYALVVPVLAGLLAAFASGNVRLKRALPALGAVTVAYAVLRLLLPSATFFPGRVDSAWWQRLPGAFAALPQYARIFFLPWPLHMEYGNPHFAVFGARVLGGVLLLVALLWAAVKTRRSLAFVSFGIFWFLAALLPVLNIFPVNAYLAEHWLAVPSVGLILIVVSGLVRLWDRGNRAIAGAAFAVLCAGSAALTFQQSGLYGAPERLWAHTLRFAPQSSRAHHNKGVWLLDQQRYAEAQASLSRAIELEPGNADSLNALGVVMRRQGRAAEAVPFFCAAVRQDPGFADALYNLGNAYLALSRTDEAIASFREALRRAPDGVHAASYHNNLASAYALRGETKEALAHLRAALALDPHNAVTRQNLHTLEGAMPTE